MKPTHLSRRTFLRGMGTAMAIPWLEAMAPARLLAHSSRSAPLRLAFLYVPNGVQLPAWTPREEGADFALPTTLEPLAPHRDQLLVLSGLTHDKARANGDGPGDHARAAAVFLTGAQPHKSAGRDIRVGISADQVAAQKIGAATRLRSLELGCEGGRSSGQCDSGYACVYSNNISWSTPHTPVTKEIDPRQVFDRLFLGGSSAEQRRSHAERAAGQGSILDYVRADAERLARDLGATDRRKLDEYLTAVREIERRVERTGRGEAMAPAGSERPAGIPKKHGEHIRLMCDLLALAFQADITRVATFMFANEGSNRSHRAVGVSEGHHTLSHHGKDPDKRAKLQRIDRFNVEQLAYLLGRLAAIREGEGSLLDHAMIVYGSGIGDGDRHNHDNLPVLLCGRGGGSLAPGRHLRYSRETPMNNLFLSLLDRMNAPLPRHGDSTGRLPYLDG